MKFILLLAVLVLAFSSVSASRSYAEIVGTYRNVSTYKDALNDLFVATAVRIDVLHGKKGDAIIEDALRLIMYKNQLDYAHFRAGAWKSTDGMSGVNGAAFEFYMQFVSLVEYKEVNGQPGYQLVGDTFLSSYPLSTAEWIITTSIDDHTFDDGEMGKLYSVAFATADNVFNYSLSFSGRPTTLGKTKIDANSAKISFDIQYYNFIGATNDAESRVGMLLVVAAGAKAGRAYSAPNNGVSAIKVNLGGYGGYINFEDTADMWDAQAVYKKGGVNFQYSDSTSQGSVSEGYEASAVFLSYDQIRPMHIVHDPEMGAAIPDDTDSDSGAALTASFLLITFLAFVALF